MGSYSAPLKRFRLVVAVGILAAATVALTATFKVDVGTFPPDLTARDRPSYSAGTQLEVTSPLEPYYRSAVDVLVVTPRTTADEELPNIVEQDEPSVRTLVAAANYYPYVIEGDDVKALRERLYGPIEGEVEATAIGATLTPNRQEPGRLPFIQVVVTADSPQNAIRLAQTTADAFIRFVRIQQERRNIRSSQRLLVKQLRKPEKTFEMGGTSMNLPILIFVALAFVACAIAYMLDRLFPTRGAGQPVGVEADHARRDDPQLVAASGHDA